MLERVISGGQTGSDQAAWRVAKACAIPTGGFMPAGFLTDDGPQPDELATPDYPTTRPGPAATSSKRRPRSGSATSTRPGA
jgi:hypothetical protein